MKLLKLVPDNTNIDFMGWRNVALILSLLLTIASLVLVGYRGLNLGIDFVGGQVVRATFAQPVDIEDLRGLLNAGYRRGGVAGADHRGQQPGQRGDAGDYDGCRPRDPHGLQSAQTNSMALIL